MKENQTKYELVIRHSFSRGKFVSLVSGLNSGEGFIIGHYRSIAKRNKLERLKLNKMIKNPSLVFNRFLNRNLLKTSKD